MSQLTDEQSAYVNFNELIDTKLIATAGSGKTFTIIQKMDHIINDKILKSEEILMLTFSRFTRDDFINRINKNNIKSINIDYIKTIDSFAKSIIDPHNEVDVSILSYKFMKYLELTKSSEIKKNAKIKNIRTIFVDEAQDLNETQYKILCLLKKKNKTVINLIGDPNQNIYQFRGSSDKYLSNFQAKTFYLTYNFRSHQEVVEFSKYLRPNQDVDIICKKSKINRLPVSVFYKDEDDLEINIIALLKNAEKNNIDLSDFAILSPTRGRMRSDGKSNGLCLISNILFKNGYKFKQFYEEATDELANNIQYIPEQNHINILTFMGSKGLEWKYTIIIDAETCLINKKIFTEEKHKGDQYLLYVACSRAINNLFIFAKYTTRMAEHIFHFNPWFALVPETKYRRDERFDDVFQFQKIKERITHQEEKKINKIIEQCSEEDLYNLAILCDYGVENSNSINEQQTIYELKNKKHSNMFISRYIKELFFIYYNIANNLPLKKFHDIENIINLDVIMRDLSPKFLNWYYWNRNNLTWETFDKEKDKEYFDPEIKNIIETNFKRTKDLSEHVIVPDCYFKNFILKHLDDIKENYQKYLDCYNNDNDKIMEEKCIKVRKYLFKMMVLIYSLETQHYYHVLNKGYKFKHILNDYIELFDKIKIFCFNKGDDAIRINESNIQINKLDLIGEIDFIEIKNFKKNFYDIKCSSDITLKHIIYQTVCNILYNNLDEYECENHDINLNFLNLITGKLLKIKLFLTKKKIKNILDILIKNKKNIK
jgi:hypothetical protein